jgi:hypothetical protein
VGAVRADVSADTAEYWGGGVGGGGGALQSLFSTKTKLELTLTLNEASRNIEQLHVRVSSTLWPRMKVSKMLCLVANGSSFKR